MNVRDLLIALVRYAVLGGELDIDAVQESLNEKKMATLFKVAKKHDVAHLVCYSLKKIGYCNDGEVWQSFLNEEEQARLRFEMIQADINEICACFEEEKIDYIPLKGAIIRHYYTEQWMRPSCDIDILVREGQLDRAVSALVEKRAYKTDYKKTFHDISLYSPFGMHLELHYNIKEKIEKYDKLLTQVWEFSSKKEENRFEYVQSNEFFIFHLISHMAYHFICGGCGFRSVLDLWLLKNELSIDENKLDALLSQAELSTFYGAMIKLGEYWFEDNNQAAPITLEAETFILLGGIYGTDKQAAATKQIKKGGKLKYFWSRIFLPYESLAILYPIIKKHKILTPFCQIARWLGAIFKGKRVSKEIKNVASVNKEQSEKTRGLLEGLGL